MDKIQQYLKNTLEGGEEGGGERPKGEVGDVGLKNKQYWKFLTRQHTKFKC